MLEQRFNAYVRNSGTLTQKATSSAPRRCQSCLNMAASFVFLHMNADGGLLGVYISGDTPTCLTTNIPIPATRGKASGAWQLFLRGNPSAHRLETTYRALCNHWEFSRPQLKTRGHTSTSASVQPIWP